MKTRGFLTYPSRPIFLYIKELESCFKKHADSINVFDDTFDELLQNISFKLQWGCAEHKSKVMTNIYVHYILYNNAHEAICLCNKPRNEKTK